jgi:predicted NACHT family NTPase
LGWLNQVGIDTERKPVYAFFHASFQEYFAATAIDDWDFFLPRHHKNKPIENKQYRIFTPQWKQTILLWFGRKDLPKAQKEAFIQALINFQDGCVKYKGKSFYGYRAYFLAAAAIAEFKDCEQADPIVKQIVDWELYNSLMREQAKVALQETERIKAIAALVQLLDTSQDQDTRRYAAESLGKIDKRYNSMYEFIWQCAQNLPYPEFYQAWHQPFLATRLLRSLKSILFMRIF